jgi:hypothetical protein
MRKLKNAILIILMALGTSQAQVSLAFSETVQVDSVSKKDLFNRAKSWFGETYKNSKEVLQIQDIENGELLGKAIFNYSSNEYVRYTIKILIKDGKYKCEIYEFEHHCYNTYSCLTEYGPLSTDSEYPRMPPTIAKKRFNKEWTKVKTSAELNAKGTMALHNDAMIKKPKDW